MDANFNPDAYLQANGASPSFLTSKLTQYGYKDDPTPDSNTQAGLGILDAPLRPGAIALTDSMRAKLKAQPGDVIQVTDKNGQIHHGYYTDRAPQKEDRVDFYKPEGYDETFPDEAQNVKNLGGGSALLKGQELTATGFNNLSKYVPPKQTAAETDAHYISPISSSSLLVPVGSPQQIAKQFDSSNHFDPEAYLQANTKPAQEQGKQSFDPSAYLKANQKTAVKDPILEKAKDPTYDPAQDYASYNPNAIDVNPEHFGGNEKALENPVWQANVQEYERQKAAQQVAIDVIKARNKEESEAPAQTMLQKTGRFIGEIPSAIKQGAQGAVSLFETPVEALAQTGIAALADKNSPSYQNAQLKKAGIGIGVENALYNPETGSVATDLGLTLEKAGQRIGNWIHGKPTTDDAIRAQLEQLAPSLRSKQVAKESVVGGLKETLGVPSDSNLTPEAEQVLEEYAGKAAGAAAPENIALLGAGKAIGSAGKGISSAKGALGGTLSEAAAQVAEHPAIAPVVQMAKQSAEVGKTVAGNTLVGAGKIINTVGSGIGSKGAEMVGGALVAHSIGESPWLGALVGRLANPLIKPIGNVISTTGKSVSEYGKNLAGPAIGDQLELGLKQAPTQKGSVSTITNSDLWKGAVGGAVFSIPNVIGSDSPEEAADAIGNGLAFGMLGSLANKNYNAGLRRFGAQKFAERAPKAYGEPVQINGQPVDLDALHEKAVQGLNKNQQLNLQAMRGFLPGAQIYALHPEDMAMVAKVAGLPETAGLYDAPQISTELQVNGRPQKVILLNSDLAALNHEAGHYIWDNVPDSNRQSILESIAKHVPESDLQEAYQKYTLQLARAYNFGQKIDPRYVSWDQAGNPVFAKGIHGEEQQAVEKAISHFDQNPTTLLNEYIAEQFNDLANDKQAPVESLAGQAVAGKSVAQLFSDAFAHVQQALGGEGRTTALGFKANPKIQNQLRESLSQQGKQPYQKPSLQSAPSLPNVPQAEPKIIQAPLVSQQQVQSPEANWQKNAQAYTDAQAAAESLKVPKSKIQKGLQSATEAQANDTESILRHILGTSKPKEAPASSLANAPSPVDQPKQENQSLQNIRVQTGEGPKASIDPFARNGTLSSVPPLTATEGKPSVGLRPGVQRRVDKKTGDVLKGVPTNYEQGRAINPNNPREAALAEKAAQDSGNPEQFKTNLQAVEVAIANGHELGAIYNSARSAEEGSPTNQERGQAQELSDLNLVPKEGVQKTITPQGLKVYESKEPIFTSESAQNGKERANRNWTKALTKSGALKANSSLRAFQNIDELHQAIDEVVKAKQEERQVQGLMPPQVTVVHNQLDSEPKQRFIVEGYSQDKVIANAKNLSEALALHEQDPILKKARDYLLSGEWTQDLKDRNENMAKGYRGDGGIFTDEKGNDISKEYRQGKPVKIPDDKIQILNALEGGPSTTFYKEAQVNAKQANRTITEKPLEESTNPFYQKLKSLGENLSLQRQSGIVQGVNNILSPASESLRLDRLQDTQAAPLQLPPSSYAQRAAAFMPKVAPATYLGEQEQTGGKPAIPLYNLTENIEGHSKGSTVSAQTLQALGFELPEKKKPNLSEAQDVNSYLNRPKPVKTLEKIHL